MKPGWRLYSTVVVERWELAMSGFTVAVQRDLSMPGSNWWMSCGGVVSLPTYHLDATTREKAKTEALDRCLDLLHRISSSLVMLMAEGA